MEPHNCSLYSPVIRVTIKVCSDVAGIPIALAVAGILIVAVVTARASCVPGFYSHRPVFKTHILVCSFTDGKVEQLPTCKQVFWL